MSTSRPRHRRRRRAALGLLILLTLAAAGLRAAVPAWLERPRTGATPAAAARDALDRGWERLRTLDPQAAATLAPPVGRALADRGDLGAALARVRSALAEDARRRASSDEAWRAFEPVLAAAVETAAERAAAPGLERREARWVERARLRLATARRLAGEGRTSEALGIGGQALALTEDVGASHRRLFARFTDPQELRAWRAWTEAAVAESRRSKRPVVLVDKLTRKLHLLERGRRLATFDVELGTRGLERKLHQGDRATPEGRYRVSEVKTGGRTRYYKALLLDYPNADDLARLRRAQERGEVARDLPAGNLIEIHGHGGQGRDWTDGCVALRDRDMDRLVARVGVGTSVTIVGTADGRLGSETEF